MKILLQDASTELIVKNSRFIAEVFPVTTQAEAREKLHDIKIKYSDATHVVHAFVTGLQGETCGMSDDGEPSGTAGRPVLDVLKGSGITNILLTVTRYFGGTLLGTGGLVHAYSDSAKAVLNICQSEEYVAKSQFKFTTDYSSWQSISYLMQSYHIQDVKEEYDSAVNVTGKIWTSESQEFAQRIKDGTKGRTEVELKCI